MENQENNSEISAPAGDGVTEKPKRKRGRPRKHPVEIKPTESTPVQPEKKPRKKRGRPPGKSKPKLMVVVEPSRCKKCGSTDRTDYTNRHELDQGGISPTTGEVYNLVVWRDTKCKNCGQSRCDKTFENTAKQTTADAV